jgi:hypothetical protein
LLRSDRIFALPFQTAVKRFEGASNLCQGAVNRLLHSLRPIGNAQRPMPGRTGLDQAPLIVYTEFATVDVAEVDFHTCEFAAKPLQKPIHFASDELDHSRVYRYIFVAIDLNSHAFPLFPPALGAQKTSRRSDSKLESMILFGG